MADQSDLLTYSPYTAPQDAYGDKPVPNSVTYQQQVESQPKNWQQQAWNEIYPSTQVQSRGGDYGDTSQGQLENQLAETKRASDAQDQWTAWENSPYRTRFPNAPDPATAMRMRDQRVAPPDIRRLTYMPGAPPDVLLDSETGDMYRYQNGGRVYYAGNVTLPQVDELTRASASVVAGLRARGMLGDPVPHPLKSDHSWKSQTSPKAAPEEVVNQINRNTPSMDDIGNYLSNQSGTVWAQMSRAGRRATGIGMALSVPLTGAAGAAFAPAEAGGLALAGGGLGGAAAGLGASAAAGGLGMLAGQIAGQKGDLSQIDWTAIAKTVLASGVGGAVGRGIGALATGLGAAPAVAGGAQAISSKVTSQGVGSLFPQPNVNITAYQPYPGMSPEAARRIMTSQLGY